MPMEVGVEKTYTDEQLSRLKDIIGAAGAISQDILQKIWEVIPEDLQMQYNFVDWKYMPLPGSISEFSNRLDSAMEDAFGVEDEPKEKISECSVTTGMIAMAPINNILHAPIKRRIKRRK